MSINNITGSFADLLHLFTVRPVYAKEAVMKFIKYFVSELYKVHQGHRGFLK